MLTLYTGENCPICRRVKKLLIDSGVAFDEIDLDDEDVFAVMLQRCLSLGVTPRSKPVIISGDYVVSGEDCVVAIEEGEV